jgi:hypothetical protein
MTHCIDYRREKCAKAVVKKRNDTFLIASIIIITLSVIPRVSDHTKQNQDWNQWRPSHSNPEVLLQTATRMTGNGFCTFN